MESSRARGGKKKHLVIKMWQAPAESIEILTIIFGILAYMMETRGHDRRKS